MGASVQTEQEHEFKGGDDAARTDDLACPGLYEAAPSAFSWAP
jgi:hypothetical protein